MNKNAVSEGDKISEGEIYLQEFFEAEGIYFKFNEKIDFLEGDNKSCRYADFYLPRYNLYVEFFGRWNINDEEKQRYNEKRRIYDKNNIACIYLYPDNLGWIKYLFNYRAMKELKDKGRDKYLFRLRFRIVLSRNPNIFFKLGFYFLGLLLVLLFPNINPQYNLPLIGLCVLFIGLEVVTIFWEYRMLVKKKFHTI